MPADLHRSPGARRRPRPSGSVGLPLVLLLAVVGVVVVFGAAGLLVGVRDSQGEREDTPAAAPVPASPSAAVSRGAETTTGPEVRVAADGSGHVAVDRLDAGAVLRVTASGFDPFSVGEVAQCSLEADGVGSCTNRFPVVFGPDGTARFQYAVTDALRAGGRCGPDDRPCILQVATAAPRAAARLLTVFHGAARPAGTVVLEPASGLRRGDTITVQARGFPPATRLVAAQCPRSGNRCAAPVAGVTDDRGAASLRLPAVTGRLGDGRCGPRAPCAVRVVADAAIPRVSAGMTFSSGPAARYDAGRVALGIAIAGLLLALAAGLVRRTDWSGPAEAATPAMDSAVLDS